MTDDLSIPNLLRRIGPCRSSRLSHALQSRRVSYVTARQKVCRARDEYQRLIGVQLPRREQFIYLSEQYQTPEFWSHLIRDLREMDSAYALAVDGLAARGGIVQRSTWDVVSGSPDRLGGHLSSEHVLDRLVKIGWLRLAHDPACGECVTFTDSYDTRTHTTSEFAARTLAESLLLKALQDWLRKTGLGSWNKVQIRDRGAPDFGHFRWDATAPSYVHPLVRKDSSGIAPGFIVADATMNALPGAGVRYFLNKCRVLRNLKSVRPFLPILLAADFEESAFKLRSEIGALFVTPSTLFGANIGEGLRVLVHTLTNAGAAAVKNPESIPELFGRLSEIEGAAGNLRGPLFELIVMNCAHQEGGSVDHRVPFSDPDDATKHGDIDVLRVKGREFVVAYECKGRGPGSTEPIDNVKNWLEERVPRMRKSLLAQERFAGSKLVFEFWTTAQFDAGARAFLTQRRDTTRKYAIDFKDGNDVLAYTKKIRATALSEVLQEHYLSHPLAKAAAGSKARTTRPSRPID